MSSRKMDVDSMKYAELRSLAKQLGLKANMKADKLLKSIKQHYEQEEDEQVNGNAAGGVVVEDPEDTSSGQNLVKEEPEAAEDPVPSTALFVTSRRGRGARAKRKVPDTHAAADLDAEPPLAAAEEDKSSAVHSAGGAKRRRVSSELDQVPELCDKGKAKKVAKAGKIPRHEGLLKKTKPVLNPITPNFKKLHEAHFNKMESIDSYVQRKTKQVETYQNSVKDLKFMSEKTLVKPAGAKNQLAKPARASLFSPAASGGVAEGKRRVTGLAATKASLKEPASFRPSVLSTRRINVQFSQATQDNEYKRSLVKTPARMTSRVSMSTPGKKSQDGGNASAARSLNVSVTKPPGTFVFAGNTSVCNTPGTNKKPSFDLKASLSRPLSYKPHQGKLKPFEAKENGATNKSLISHSHQKNFKQHQVKTREERRARQVDGRKQKKENLLGTRRGLVMT